jgi:hypothetical protein
MPTVADALLLIGSALAVTAITIMAASCYSRRFASRFADAAFGHGNYGANKSLRRRLYRPFWICRHRLRDFWIRVVLDRPPC